MTQIECGRDQFIYLIRSRLWKGGRERKNDKRHGQGEFI